MKKEINLVRALRYPVQSKKQVDKIHVIFLCLMVVLVMAMGGTSVYINYSLKSHEERILYLKNEISKVDTELKLIGLYKSTYEAAKKYNINVAEVLTFLKTFPTISEETFSLIDNNLIEGMSIQNFAIERSIITFKLSAKEMTDIISYVFKLRESKIFSRVDWGNSIKFDNDVFYCNISITLMAV